MASFGRRNEVGKLLAKRMVDNVLCCSLTVILALIEIDYLAEESLIVAADYVELTALLDLCLSDLWSSNVLADLAVVDVDASVSESSAFDSSVPGLLALNSSVSDSWNLVGH